MKTAIRLCCCFDFLLFLGCLMTPKLFAVNAVTFTDNNPFTTVVSYNGSFTYSVSYQVTGNGISSVPIIFTKPSGAVNYSGYPLTYTFTYTINNVSSSDDGAYSLYISDGLAQNSSTNIYLRVSPAILTQPQNTTCLAGSSTTMGIAAGPSTATFQWIDSATGSIIQTGVSFSPTAANNGERVYCKISNSYGSASSSSAVLTVGTPPTISSQPTNVAAIYSSTVTFSVTANGTQPLYYQWFQNGVAIQGANLNYITFESVTNANVGTYQVAITNYFGNTNSAIVTLNAGTSVLITNQPSSLIVTQGQTASFAVSASGSLPISYQWKKNGTKIAGATNNIYSIINTVSTSAATYTVTVTNLFSSITSSNAILTVLTPVTISTQPQNQTAGVGSNATFSVSATAGASQLFYQWFNTNNAIANQTNASLTLQNVQLTDSGSSYFVVITNSFGSITSSIANLTVQQYAPAIVIQPIGGNVAEGSNFTFNVSATGTTLAYQWQNDNGIIANANANSLTLSNLDVINSGNYSVIITNPVDSITSSVAVLNVGYPPVVIQQPISVSTIFGGSANVSCVVTGTPAIALQWLQSGTPLAGQTNAILSISNIQSAMTGLQLSATNAFGGTLSSSAILTVLFPPTITTQPTNQFVTVGSNATLFVAATGTLPLLYQWFNGSNVLSDIGDIIGSTSNILSLSPTTANDGGCYSVIVENSYGSITSSMAVLNVGYPPVIVQQPISVTTSFGDAASFSCIATSTVPIAFQWLENGTALAGQTNENLTLTNILYPITAIQLSATNSFGGTESSNASINVSFLSGYPSNLYSGLVAYYPFNQNANDCSGNGNNGTVNGAVLTTDRFGNTNSAYSFDGVSSYISFNSVPLSQTDNWTIAAWIQPASLNQNGSAVTVGYDDGITGNGFAFDVAGANSGELGNQLIGVFGSVASIGSGYSFTNIQWYQVIMLQDSGVTEFFVNGLQVDTNAGLTPYTPTSFTIGSATGTRFFNGSISNVRIYNRPLLSSEVYQLYILESSNMPPQNLSASPNENNSFQLQFFGTPNYPYILQATTNLTPPISWQPIITNNSDVFGNWIFTDTNAVLYPSRFYRAMVIP